MYRVAIVCEGPTDRAILEAVVDVYLDDYESIAIQPPSGKMGGASGPFGGGWKGVKTWCTNEIATENRRLSVILQNADILIIQVDADVAAEKGINRAKPCPPSEHTTNEVRSLILEWLELSDLPEQVVLCVPSMASETWVLVALLSKHLKIVPCEPPPEHDLCVECRTDIKATLRSEHKKLKAKLVTSKGGKLKNDGRAYYAIQERISRNWQTVVSICNEAARFEMELKNAIKYRKG